MDTSYSKRSAAEKLGITPAAWFVLHPPPGYSEKISPLPIPVTSPQEIISPAAGVHFFIENLAQADALFPQLAPRLASNGSLWVSWPKAVFRQDPFLNENSIRESGLKSGLVDVKVISLDDTWSGLKFVFRLKDRPKG